MEYEIKGSTLPVVICHLAKGESITSDGGAMAWMDPCLKMETIGGGTGKLLGRMFSGESLFQNRYTAQEDGKIAFASSLPGSIVAIKMDPSKDIIAQKSAFLASYGDINLSVHFNKKFTTGLLGGEGFIMNRLSGSGTVFLEIDGEAIEYTLVAGQQIIVDTGFLAMMDATCTIEIATVPGMKNKFLGGEGLFNTMVTGPGRVVLQTMPIQQLATRIIPYIPTSN